MLLRWRNLYAKWIDSLYPLRGHVLSLLGRSKDGKGPTRNDYTPAEPGGANSVQRPSHRPAPRLQGGMRAALAGWGTAGPISRSPSPPVSIKKEKPKARVTGRALTAGGKSVGPKRRKFVFVHNRLEGNATATITATLAPG